MKPRARFGWSFALFGLVLSACAEKHRAQVVESSHVGAEVKGQPLLAPFDVTLTATADTTISQGTPTLNFGTDSSINITGVALSGWDAGLVSFDAAAIQNAVGTNTLQSARLQFTMTSAALGAGNSQVAIHRMTQAWVEQRATWLCANDTDHSLLGRFVNNAQRS